MKAEKLNKLLEQGFKPRMYLKEGSLKCYLYSDNTNTVHPVYYNHIKRALNDNQMQFIETFNTVKNWAFRDDVEMNMKSKALKETKEDIQNRIMRVAVKSGKYLAQD